MKTFLQLAQQRVSIRKYLDKPVPEEALADILEAGRLAPSAANRQPWMFIVVKNASVRDQVAQAYPRDWFREAPVYLVVCVEESKAWHRADGKSYVDVDGAIAMDHMTLCAADVGLGTCWIGAFDKERLSKALTLPSGIEPLVMTPLGYPAETGRPKSRKPLEEIIGKFY